MSDLDKNESEDGRRKHTLVWRPEDYERVERAAHALSQEIHAEVSVPDFMRGAILRRADEILASEAA